MADLVIDIGNTRIKWASLDHGRLQPQSAAPHADWTAQIFVETILAPQGSGGRVWVSNVAGPRMADVVRTALAQARRDPAEFVISTAAAGGVRNAYPQPMKLGVDRWLAIIGAHALERGAVCIVSVGTAMTIDAVDAQGVHLGGVIIPGPDLMVSSLLKNTSDIAQRAEQGSTSDGLFADNTLGAIRQGADHAAAALVERAVNVLRQQLNETPTLLLTGGASARLENSLALPYRMVSDLVLQGLAVIATEAQR
ncbi:MAG TPA: type III pantothenate kinase [Steroidobacteraceae bacterium]|nr:type III pantothenate kinase [Steroidobacteraceae bacterium]